MLQHWKWRSEYILVHRDFISVNCGEYVLCQLQSCKNYINMLTFHVFSWFHYDMSVINRYLHGHCWCLLVMVHLFTYNRSKFLFWETLNTSLCMCVWKGFCGIQEWELDPSFNGKSSVASVAADTQTYVCLTLTLFVSGMVTWCQETNKLKYEISGYA